MRVRDWADLPLEPEFQGKDLAIVGNAGYLAELEQGPRIDQHDLVLRMNNFRTAGYERHVGTKLDIFMTTFYHDVDLARPELRSARFVVSAMPNNFSRGRNPRLNDRHAELIAGGMARLRRREVFVPSRERFNSLYQKIGRYPTTGALAIALSLDHLLRATQRIYLTGFSFFEGRSHYFSDQRVCASNHDLTGEARLLAEYLAPALAAKRISMDPVMNECLQRAQRKCA